MPAAAVIHTQRRVRLAGGMANALCLAATPVFALMAVITAQGNATMLICSVHSNILPLNGMTFMYLLMSLFHLRPWLRRMAGTRVATH